MLKKLIILAVLILVSTPLFAQSVDTAWVRRYNGPWNYQDEACALAVDHSGNAYVTGTSYGIGTETDYATVKYYPDGDTAWVRRYSKPGDSGDEARGIAIDDSGNVYVTGVSCNSDTEYNYATIKYYPDGDTAWVRSYNGTGNKYDNPCAIAVDNSGNAYVTGYSYGDGTSYDYATIKYAPDGDTVWVRRYNRAENSDDKPSAITVDGSGNVYVTGYSYLKGVSLEYVTIKYDSNGNELWISRYDGNGYGTALAIDSSGDVYVTGFSQGIGTDWDFATIKYYPDGDTAWVRRYDGPANADDRGYAIAVDGHGNVCVTGFSTGGSGYQVSYDFATIKYYPDGDTAWVRRYDGPIKDADIARAIAVDRYDNVYVTGESYSNQTWHDYATIKYYPNGDTAWLRRFDGPGSAGDYPFDLVLDDSFNVYVTGKSEQSRTYPYNEDYATVKYFQSFIRGDANGDGKKTISDVVYLVNYLFKGGHPPIIFIQAGDTNCDDKVQVSDVVYLINYLFKGGPPPAC